jgi:hypothetical protein
MNGTETVGEKTDGRATARIGRPFDPGSSKER